MGNHEEMLVYALESRSEFKSWVSTGGQATLDSYGYWPGKELMPAEHVQFIRGCLDFFATETHILVHANYLPSQQMDRIGSRWLRWEFLESTKMCPHFSGKIVVVGHTPQENGEVLDLGFLVCLDTDCSRGGWLSALEVGTGRVIQTSQNGDVRSRKIGTTVPEVGPGSVT
jgi:serine/threonine protein phosphatase 1